ncbi:Serine threonine kinase [Olea europaea subsp. europaea]|uniref:Serine threonine kinase n=1 Tax=Olea europaea subsp. europaea TaxID=158383 RepID=A0A8S0V852_OLEEU|nr:Serine threonine kinase [Olea europaea subsp. europaea]
MEFSTPHICLQPSASMKKVTPKQLVPTKIMSSFALLLCLLATALSATPYRPTDQILLNCGSNSSEIDDNKRSWDGDARSKYAPPNITTTSIASKPTEQASSGSNSALYTTARIFQSQFTYNFPVSVGPKFLRLYFYAATYSDLHKNVSFNKFESFFTVAANEFTLLSNFSAYLKSTPSKPFKREFIINVEYNQSLSITFSPSPKSYAFINGIEIVSMPNNLYFGDFPIKFENQQYNLKNKTALETSYRFNVGGSYVEIKKDTGMFREWLPDNDYFLDGYSSYTPHAENLPINYTEHTRAYTAPEIVYTTSRVIANGSKSLEWSFPIDSGFLYLLRLHFCEIQQEVKNQNERVFTISINNQTAENEADVIFWTGGTEIPYFKDYVTRVSDDDRRGKKNLNLSLFPNTLSQPLYSNALLNGLEIFKLSDSKCSLAGANPDNKPNSSPSGPDTSSQKKKKNKDTSVIYPVIGSVTGFLLVLLSVSFLIFHRRRRVNDSGLSEVKSSWVPLSITSKSTTKTSGSGTSLPSDLCRHFLLEEIKLATGNFNDSFVIGMGGFGKVYKGYIENGATAVAIKRLNPSSNQGVREFETEIQMLSTLRHLHLVSLIGYCDENGEMILVYDYMVHGTLRGHLYNSENSPLQWKNRLQILIGAAKGLHYLHTGAKHMIIHRDVKTTNILLDEKWVAKVSDFGLSKIGPTGGTNTHVSTMVKGSLGYLDPEYYRRRQLTEKSDIYSFGVVLLEVLCARPPIIPNIQTMQVNLAEWAKLCYKKGTLEQIVDPNLEGKIAPECLSKYAEIAIRC